MSVGPSPIPAPPTPAPGWLGRNWKWFVPTGCLSLLVLFAVFIGAILFLISGSFKSSDAYKQAFVIAQKNPQVIQELGQPLKGGWYITGSIETSGPSGHADVATPISGLKNHGTLYIVANKSADQWTFVTLQVEIEGRSKRIDLLEKKTDPAKP